MISSLAPELAMYLQCTLSVHHPSPPVYPTTDKIIRRVKNVGPSSVETFSDLHWSDSTYALAIGADADVGRKPYLNAKHYTKLLWRTLRDDTPRTDIRNMWEKRCLRTNTALTHELFKMIDEQENEVRHWVMVWSLSGLTSLV